MSISTIGKITDAITVIVHPSDIRNVQITNADRIRSMTDEELAKFLSDEIFTIPECNRLDVVTRCDEDCNKCWHDWLKQECDSDA